MPQHRRRPTNGFNHLICARQQRLRKCQAAAFARYAENRRDRLPGLARELVDCGVAVIVTDQRPYVGQQIVGSAVQRGLPASYSLRELEG